MQEYMSHKILREFGLFVGIVFPVLVGLILPLFGGHAFRYWTLWICLPLLFVAIFKPALLFYPYKFWMKLGHVLGWINSKVILGLVFIFVVQPIAIIMKSFGYDPLKKKKTNNTSYREIRSNFKIDLRKIF